MNINDVLSRNVVRSLIQRTCGYDVEIIKRQTCFVVRAKQEDERKVERLIILCPKGYTANTPTQMNSHDEAEYATIEVRGTIKEHTHSFSLQKNCLFVASSFERGSVSKLNKPYIEFNLNEDEIGISKEFYSAGEAPFSVVRSDGFGFYHNLVNTTDDWLVLHLRKVMRPQKSVQLEKHFSTLTEREVEILQKFYQAIVQNGDGVFVKNKDLIDKLEACPAKAILPALGEMLFTFDTGKHEACSAFAMILKLGKKNPQVVLEYLEAAIREKAVPLYYAHQLKEKINQKFRDDLAA